MSTKFATKTGRVAAGGSLLVGGVAGALVLAPQAGAATTFHVTTTSDSGAGSLRQAVTDANNNAGADIIVFDASSAGTITLTTGQIVISDDVTITGLGAADSIISGDRNSRIFYLYRYVGAPTVSISGLTLTDGIESQGGAIYSISDLTLSGVVITGNAATSKGGGIMHRGGNLTIESSTISNNVSSYGGGGIYSIGSGDMTIDSSTIDQNTSVAGDGGGLYATHTDSFTMTNSTVSGNHAADGAGLELGFNGNVLIANSTIANNVGAQNDGDGGALYSNGSSGDMRIVFSTIAGNSTKNNTVMLSRLNGYGVDITGTIISDNTTSEGAGVQAVDLYLSGSPSASLTVSGSLIMGTTAGDPFTAAENVTGVRAQLGALADNGGATFTMEPAAGSPVIDAGPFSWTAFAGDGFDQRATPYVRVSNGRVDIGAFEVQSDPTPPSTTTVVSDDTTTTVGTDPVAPAFTG